MIIPSKEDGWHITDDGSYHFFLGVKSICGKIKSSSSFHDNNPDEQCKECKTDLFSTLRNEN